MRLGVTRDAERLGVLRAHPDLAGKLAQAKRLTAESSSEQAAAGLDALTDKERELFHVEPEAGEPLATTLDLDLQAAAERILEDVGPASALVAVRPMYFAEGDWARLSETEEGSCHAGRE